MFLTPSQAAQFGWLPVVSFFLGKSTDLHAESAIF
jgi:hypothetical protein